MNINIRDINKLNQKGIYAIVNSKTNKIYIGSTNNSFKRRLFFHINGLRKNKHENQYLQNSYNKHGENVFYFRILLICDDVLKWEQRALDLYKPFKKRGFNINPIANRPPLIIDKKIFLERSKTFKNTINNAIFYYKLVKNKEISIIDVPKKYINIVNHYLNNVVWNKGKSLSNEHILKLKNAERTFTEEGLKRRKETFKKIRSKISVYKEDVLLGIFDSAYEIERISKEENSIINLNVSLYRSRRGKELKTPNIFQACRTGKNYKGLFFKYYKPS